MIHVDLRTGRGLNTREHHMTRARRVKAEKEVVHWALCQHGPLLRPTVPLVVLLTRVAPSKGLDDDNLAGALKACRDQVAAWLGVSDDKNSGVQWLYEQRRGPWGVEIQWGRPKALTPKFEQLCESF